MYSPQQPTMPQFPYKCDHKAKRHQHHIGPNYKNPSRKNMKFERSVQSPWWIHWVYFPVTRDQLHRAQQPNVILQSFVLLIYYLALVKVPALSIDFVNQSKQQATPPATLSSARRSYRLKSAPSSQEMQALVRGSITERPRTTSSKVSFAQ